MMLCKLTHSLSDNHNIKVTVEMFQCVCACIHLVGKFGRAFVGGLWGINAGR